MHGLATLSSLNNLLKLGTRCLDLASSVTNVLQLLVSVNIYEVIVTG